MAKPEKSPEAPAKPAGGKAAAAPAKGQPAGKAPPPPGKGQPPGKGPAAGRAPAGAKGKPAEEAAPPARARSTGRVPPRLRERFRTAIVPALVKERGYGNPLEVPRLEKIVINMGLGEARDNVKVLDHAVADLTTITGQKPVITKAKKSIANFKLRTGMSIGVKVTLRGARMFEFLDRLVNVALPRVRDFKGVSPKSFDGRGNYALGLREQVIFPEIVYDKIDKVRGMDVIICTSARSDEEAKALLTHLGVPFRE
jgi:large subunit ribosomal protein L5